MIAFDAPRAGPILGETVPPALLPLLEQLGLGGQFLAECPKVDSTGVASCWGSSEPAFQDYIREPGGRGWHLDRAAFNTFLLEAVERSSVVIERRNATVSGLEGAIVINASGRGSSLRLPGDGPPEAIDHLLATARFWRCRADGEYALIEAHAEGWCYNSATAGWPHDLGVVHRSRDSSEPWSARFVTRGTHRVFGAAARCHRKVRTDRGFGPNMEAQARHGSRVDRLGRRSRSLGSIIGCGHHSRSLFGHRGRASGAESSGRRSVRVRAVSADLRPAVRAVPGRSRRLLSRRGPLAGSRILALPPRLYLDRFHPNALIMTSKIRVFGRKPDTAPAPGPCAATITSSPVWLCPTRSAGISTVSLGL